MSLFIAGHFRLAPEDVQALQPAMEAVIAATRAEDGCEEYGFALDVLDPGVIRVFEIWRDKAAHEAHHNSAHMAEWLATRAKMEVLERRLTAYEIAFRRPV